MNSTRTPSIALSFLAVSFMTSTATGTSPRLFDYFARIPATANTCAQEAALMGLRFAQATKLQVTGTRCVEELEVVHDGIPTKLYSLRVSYQAEGLPAKHVVTFEADVTTPSGALPGYDEYAACLNDLRDQTQTYEAETGLMAVSAGCEVARSAVAGYTARIEGFGDPAKRAYPFKVNFHGTVGPEVELESKEILQAQGARIVRDLGSTVYYYATSQAAIRQHLFGFYSNPTECQAQLASAEAILRSSGSTRAIVRCSKGDWSTALDGLGDGATFLYGHSGLSIRYSSFDACLSDRGRALTEAAKSHSTVYGAICERNPYAESTYKMAIYAR